MHLLQPDLFLNILIFRNNYFFNNISLNIVFETLITPCNQTYSFNIKKYSLIYFIYVFDFFMNF